MLVVLLLLLVVGGGVALVATSGGDDESGGTGDEGDGGDGGAASPDTPVGAVEAFFAAVADGDCTALGEMTVQNESRDEMLQACQSAPEEFGVGISLVDAQLSSEDGASAVVTASFDVPSGGASYDPETGEATTETGTETTSADLVLVQEGDRWLLDATSLESGTSPQGGGGSGSGG